MLTNKNTFLSISLFIYKTILQYRFNSKRASPDTAEALIL